MNNELNDLLQATQYFSDLHKCQELLIKLRWRNGVECAFCKHNKVYHLQGKNKRYKCARCLKQFSIIKGTIFENSPISLQKWFVTIYLLLTRKKGISSTELSRILKVTQKTSWFMLHRLRFMLQTTDTSRLKGVLQIDETFVGGKNKNRPWYKKVKNSQGRSYKDKIPVLGILDENRQIYTRVIPNTKAKTIVPIINKKVEKGSIIVTDEWKAYNRLSKNYEHYIVDHSRSQYVNSQGFTTNALEGAWSHLKRMIIGVYHKVSFKHLQKYCDEFSFRYNTMKLTNEERFICSFYKVERRLTYKALINYCLPFEKS